MADHYQTIHNNFDRLVVYGCSNTGGEELADHLALGISFDECNRLKKQTGSVKKFEEAYHKGVQIKQILKDFDFGQRNKDLSYASSLAKKLNLECDNRSLAGNSQSHMYWELVRDFYYGSIKNRDLVMIGCTLIERVLMMQKNKDNKLITQGITMPLANEIAPELFKACDLLYSLEKWIWEYYNTLQLFENFAHQNNITLMMVPTTSHDINIFHPDGWLYDQFEIDPIVKNHASKIWKNLRKTIMITDAGLEDFITPLGVAGWKHYPQVNHDDYANHLYQQLKLFGNFIRV